MCQSATRQHTKQTLYTHCVAHAINQRLVIKIIPFVGRQLLLLKFWHNTNHFPFTKEKQPTFLHVWHSWDVAGDSSAFPLAANLYF